MSSVYVATDEETFNRIVGQANRPVVRFGDTSAEADEFILVGPNAFEKMHELRARGLPPTALKYFGDDSDRVRHFHWDKIKKLSELPPTLPGKYHACGISGLKRVLRWRYPELIVTAGPYGSGKSLFGQLLAQDIAETQGVPVSLCCWEDQAEDIRDAVMRHRDTAMARAGDEVQSKFFDLFHIATIPPNQDRFLSDYLDLVEYQAQAFGCRHFLLDPWNEFDHQKHSRQSETEYVREVMKALRRLVDRLKIQINIVTHVSAEYINPDGSLKPFRVAHAFGSSQFANKMDRGFCVLRSNRWAEEGESHMIIRQDKVKREDKPGYDRMGRKATLAMVYNDSTHSLYFDGKVTADEELQKIWRG